MSSSGINGWRGGLRPGFCRGAMPRLYHGPPCHGLPISFHVNTFVK